jgi:hypothetical protein
MIPVDGLLIGLVREAKVLLRHVHTSEEVPGLTVGLIGGGGALEEGDGLVRVALLVA